MAKYIMAKIAKNEFVLLVLHKISLFHICPHAVKILWIDLMEVDICMIAQI